MAWGAEFFRLHRQKLAQKLSGGLVVVWANRMMQRRNDMAYAFMQESDFWYLSGINEPDWVLIYDGTRDHAWIVQPKLTASEKLFDGEADADSLCRVSGADEAIGMDDFEQLLRTLARKHSTVYTSQLASSAIAERVVANPAQQQIHKVLERVFQSVINCRSDIAQLRAIKSDDEVAAIARAVDVTVSAFETVRQQIDTNQHEYAIEATLGHCFRKVGAAHAYDPIVAGGGHACTLHYVANNQSVRKGSAVLIDAGAELDGYCADITRTYVRGTPTKRYQQLHHALQDAQRQIIDSIAPHMPIADYLRHVDGVMQRMLCDVGLLRAPDDERYREYFPHAISHGLGIDVHDSLGGLRTLDPGMVLTVEPGVYIRDENIGIRLEDDIVVTRTGCRNLSKRLSTDY